MGPPWFSQHLKKYTWQRKLLTVAATAFALARRALDGAPSRPRASPGAPLAGAPVGESPYLPSALRLNKNPHLGWHWQRATGSNASFSWRTCFREPDRGGAAPPDECLEGDLGAAPAVDDGWVPDAAMIRTMLVYGRDRRGDPFPPPLSSELCEDIGVDGTDEDDGNKECLREAAIRSLGPLNATTVAISPRNHFGAPPGAAGEPLVEVPSPGVMCLVYTVANAHRDRIRAMRETWAGGCDGFLAFSTRSDPRLPAIALEHEGEESYLNMWQKVRSIWKFVGTHYLDDYDWFYIGGDDLFVLPHNLKAYLASLAYKDGADPAADAYFVGRRMNFEAKGEFKVGYHFNYGGPGYALSRAALRRFLAAMDAGGHWECSAGARTQAEDMAMSRCLRYLGVPPVDTRDARGRERFHPFSPGWHLRWRAPGPGDQGGYYEYAKGFGILEGRDCCAPDSVSFHYVRQASMVRHLHALLHSC